MKKLHYTVVSEEMVWLWYYDQLGSKHVKELFAKEARDFIKECEKQEESIIKQV
jgi:hypothetical protein